MTEKKQMSFEQRVTLQNTIEGKEKCSLTSLAKKFGCNRSTIYREIKHRIVKKDGKQFHFLNERPLRCERLNKFPFCCNSCFKAQTCARDQEIYSAYDADADYKITLHEKNKGPQIIQSKLASIDREISPKIQNGQSIYHVMQNSSVGISASTIRRYINNNYLTCRNIDLPRTVRYKYHKSYNYNRKRVNVRVLGNRMFTDYQKKIAGTNEVTLEMDTVIGKKTDKKCILTIYEPTSKLQCGYIVSKSIESINNKVNEIVNQLEANNLLFFDNILTDNGLEFQGLPILEQDVNGVIRFRVFYCDPYRSSQKGGCERNHEFIRYVYKKGESFDYTSQSELDELFSHINSLKRKSLNGQSPFDCFASKFDSRILEILGVSKIKPCDIILKQKTK